jgi:hypothetical protein
MTCTCVWRSTAAWPIYRTGSWTTAYTPRHLQSRGWSVKSVDLTTDDAAAIDGDLNRLTDETVIMLHAGVRLRPDAVESLLAGGGSGRLRNRARVRRTALTAVARGGDGGARAHSRGCVRQCHQRTH